MRRQMPGCRASADALRYATAQQALLLRGEEALTVQRGAAVRGC